MARIKRSPSIRTPAEVEQLVNENMKLAYYVASRNSYKYGHDEALSMSMDGLLRAAEMWDGKSCPFGAYAGMRINWRLRKHDLFLSRKKREKNTVHIHLDEPLSFKGSTSQTTLAEIIADQSAEDPSSITEDLIESLREDINKLPAILRRAIELRFGLSAAEPKCLKSAGKIEGVTAECIRLRVNQGIARLKARHRERRMTNEFE